jgi:hypothetical protein
LPLQAADAIKAMLSPTATVVRNGQRDTIDADLLVPGDVVVIKSGDKVPADLRLLECSNLQVRADCNTLVQCTFRTLNLPQALTQRANNLLMRVCNRLLWHAVCPFVLAVAACFPA